MTAKPTRRTVLTGTAASAVAAAVPAVASAKPQTDADADLWQAVRNFRRAYARFNDEWEGHKALRRRVNEKPDAPAVPTWHTAVDEVEASGKAVTYDRVNAVFQQRMAEYDAFMDRHGVRASFDHTQRLNEELGRAVNRLFATPARTAAGLHEKLKVLALARGSTIDAADADTELEAHQTDADRSWFAAVLEDADRLAREGA